MLDNTESVPVKRNSLICPCCLQFVDDVRFLADQNTNRITNGERSVRLTTQQFKLAKYLIDTFPKIATKEAIYDAAFLDMHGEGPAMKIIDVIICKIRPVMADLGLVIETVWGKGYKLVEADASEALLIKDQSIRLRTPGSTRRWGDDLDAELLELMRRKMSVTQCASIMKMPYMAVERHFKKLKPLLEAAQ
ncbi:MULTISPECIES: winged helix-turn-helix domain-containing protein [unclassified Rhizobium]|uniref:winged helix-turn-helix domain-containing protein n=1 Tax=unclassified Rhizobium TaxID=2613769 RepID=UPI00381FFA17